MKCLNCGAELDNNMSFCTTCGAPVVPGAEFTPDPSVSNIPIAENGTGNDEKTLVLDPANANIQPPVMPPEFAQNPQNSETSQQFSQAPSGMAPSGMAPQGMPPQGMPPQGMAPQGMPQPGMAPSGMAPQGMPPQGMAPQGMAPSGMAPQGMAPSGMAPQGMPPQGMAPSGMAPQGMPPQGMAPQGMPPQGMQPMYGQQPQAPKPPKAPRKPLSTGAKVGIIAGIAAVILAIVFFVVILPILKRSDLKGEYTCKDSWGDEYVAVFDDGTFVIHYDDGDDIYAAGTYTIKDNKVELIELDGDTYDGTFNEDDNMLKAYGMRFTSTNKKAKVDYKLTEDYLDNLTAQIKSFTEKAIGDEDIYDELYWGSYVTGSDLEKQNSEYLKELASELNYSSDAALQDLMGTDYLEFYVYINYDDEIEISSYVY